MKGTGETVYEIDNKKVVFEGLIKFLDDKYGETKSEYLQKTLEEYMRISTCPVCGGTRLRKESLAVTVDEKNIAEVGNMDLDELSKFFDSLSKKWKESSKEAKIAKQVIKEITITHRMSDLIIDPSQCQYFSREAQRIAFDSNWFGLNRHLYLRRARLASMPAIRKADQHFKLRDRVAWLLL
jgi:hypothetical protein